MFIFRSVILEHIQIIIEPLGVSHQWATTSCLSLSGLCQGEQQQVIKGFMSHRLIKLSIKWSFMATSWLMVHLPTGETRSRLLLYSSFLTAEEDETRCQLYSFIYVQCLKSLLFCVETENKCLQSFYLWIYCRVPLSY